MWRLHLSSTSTCKYRRVSDGMSARGVWFLFITSTEGLFHKFHAGQSYILLCALCTSERGRNFLPILIFASALMPQEKLRWRKFPFLRFSSWWNDALKLPPEAHQRRMFLSLPPSFHKRHFSLCTFTFSSFDVFPFSYRFPFHFSSLPPTQKVPLLPSFSATTHKCSSFDITFPPPTTYRPSGMATFFSLLSAQLWCVYAWQTECSLCTSENIWEKGKKNFDVARS